MIRKLRRKVAAATVAVSALVMLMFFAMGYGALVKAYDQMVLGVLRELAENSVEGSLSLDGWLMPLALVLERKDVLTPADVPIHMVVLNDVGEVTEITQLAGTAPLPEETLRQVLLQAETEQEGQCGDCWYYRADSPQGACLVIAGGLTQLRRSMTAEFNRLSLIALAPAALIVLLLSWGFSGIVVRPAKAAMQRQRQFLADAGHELKTPLTTIAVNAAAMEEDAGQSRYLRCVQEEVQRMGSLIQRMMDDACLEEPSVYTAAAEMDLTSLVYQAALPFECVALERNVQYELDIQETAVCRGNPERIRQLVSILLDNAFKYVDSNGRIMVTLTTEGNRAVLEVSNTGQGIRKEELPHIFDRFYRGDKARPGNGSYGLGLAIAKTIAWEQHGTLSVESEPGKWTTFRFVI